MEEEKQREMEMEIEEMFKNDINVIDQENENDDEF